MHALAIIAFPNIDPVAVSIGPFAIRWYALAYVAALTFAVWYMKRLVQNPALWGGKQAPLTPVQVDDLFVWATLGVVLGGRIGYVLFYNPMHYLAAPLDAFKLWQGGMSFHGGFLGVVVAFLLFDRKAHAGLDRLLDLAATATPVGLGLGRLANFINAELYGRPSDVPWAMVFPTDPAQLPRHPSQLYEALLEGAVLFVILRIATHRYGVLAHRGRASAIFAAGYGVSRIIVEWFRQPDEQIGYIGGIFTMGMILSVPLIAVGVWLYLRSRKFA